MSSSKPHRHLWREIERTDAGVNVAYYACARCGQYKGDVGSRWGVIKEPAAVAEIDAERARLAPRREIWRRMSVLHKELHGALEALGRRGLARAAVALDDAVEQPQARRYPLLRKAADELALARRRKAGAAQHRERGERTIRGLIERIHRDEPCDPESFPM